MRLRGAIRQLDFQSSAGTVIPNSTSLEYDEGCELRFLFINLSLQDALIPYLVPGLQAFFSVVEEPYGGIDVLNVAPARVGRYRARCTQNGSHRVFVPDLQIAAEVSEASTFELGGVDSFRRNDEILVMLSWEEIIQSQREQRVPKVDACGTLTARGFPFLTDNMRQILAENFRRDKYDLATKPFGKLDRSPPSPIDRCGERGRPRSKSFEGMPSTDCFGSYQSSSGYSRFGFNFSGPGLTNLRAMTQAGLNPFYNPFVPAARTSCNCFRL